MNEVFVKTVAILIQYQQKLKQFIVINFVRPEHFPILYLKQGCIKFQYFLPSLTGKLGFYYGKKKMWYTCQLEKYAQDNRARSVSNAFGYYFEFLILYNTYSRIM